MSDRLAALLDEIRACRVCAPVLPHPPRPVIRAHAEARILVAGQAPGRRVHESGVPWDDASGARLRAWLGLSPGEFYDERRLAIVGMGFCYPGTVAGADLPPRPECAPRWRARVLSELPNVRLTVLIGAYAQRWALPGAGSVEAVVRRWRAFAPHVFPLPHPSWRNTGWLKRHLWFEEELLPDLRAAVAGALAAQSAAETPQRLAKL